MKNKHLSIVLVAIMVVMFFLISSFIGDIRRLYQTGVFVTPSSLHKFYRMHRDPVLFSNINLIAGWMTLGYLNQAFNLSPSYLKNLLNVTDVTYPNITISKLAAKQNISVSVYLQNVKNLVSKYFTQNMPAQ
jgi:hypothetical protein